MRTTWIGLIPLLLLILLISCNQQKLVDTNNEKEYLQHDEDIPSKTIEETDGQVIENEELLIELTHNNENILIDLMKIPIINNYLQASKDTKKAINTINISPIDGTSHPSLYLLEFSCNNSRCSYILLDHSDDSRSYLLADLAEIETISTSPSQDKLMFVFQRKKHQAKETVTLNKLIIMDIVNWTTLPVTITFSDYTWPIIAAAWKDNQSILITIPDINEPSIEAIMAWETSSDRQTMSTELRIGNRE